MVSLTGVGVYASGAILTFGMQFLGFVVAAILQTEVFYDILGGVNFLSMAALSITGVQVFREEFSAEDTWKNTVFGILFAISRGWLLVFLAWRAHSRKGDARFDGVRDKPSIFFVYWMFQAFWVYLISLPLLLVNASANDASDETTGVAIVSYLMLTGMAGCIYIEIQSDVSKAKWVSSGRPGGFCTVGFWSMSRHPNYASEILIWVFAAIYAVLESDRSWISIVLALLSPLFTMQLLLNTSGTGVMNAEGKNLKRYYEHADRTIAADYEAYRRTTPPLFPTPFFPPYEDIPLKVKRLLFFEWERFEYRPSSTVSAEVTVDV